MTLANLLEPARLNRLEIQAQAAPGWLTPADIFERLLERAVRDVPHNRTLQGRIATQILLAMARVQRDPALSPTIALDLATRLRRGADMLQRVTASNQWAPALARLLLDREALDAALAEQRRVPQIPPGMPIGGAADDY